MKFNSSNIKPYLPILYLGILFYPCLLKAQKTDTYSLGNELKQVAQESYYVEANSFGTLRENDPPGYVRNGSSLAIFDKSDITWLQIGLDSRARFEWRHNDLRRQQSFNKDLPLLLRQRAYLGMINALDPFRFVIEFEDARRNNGNYPLDTRDANKVEIIQGYVELYLEDLIGKDPLGNYRPVSLRYGRMAFEFLDRRLISVNNWRNTTNTFTGVKLALGQDKNDWQFDVLVVEPIIRDIEKFDNTDQNRLFSAVIGHWRKWSDVVTIEPYYLGLKQTAKPENSNIERNIHGTGLRLYGYITNSGVNFDFTGMYQFGKDNQLDHSAYAITSEIGYTMKLFQTKPRISAFFGYASGDKNPNDTKSNRFERYFGFARPWSAEDYIVMENIVVPKLKVEFQTRLKDILFRLDGGYSFYWLASETDRFNNLLSGGVNNRDQTGNSGKFLGHDLDFRTRFNPVSFIAANVGYTHFTFGDFVENRQFVANGENAKNSDFLYIELSLNIVDLLSYTNSSSKSFIYNK